MALTDLTRISTSGIATGTSLSGAILHGDAHFRGTQVGVTSALFDSSDDALEFNDNVKLKFGNGGDLEIYHNGADNYIDATTGSLYIRNTLPTNTVFQTGNFLIKNQSNNQNVANFAPGANGGGKLYHENVLRFNTTSTGAVVTGILTATGFSGPTNNTSGIATFYDLRVSNNLTVEGTTTTLDTNLIGVDRVEVGANSNTVTGIAVTQSGTADIVRLYDGASQVVTVDDEGKVGINTTNPQDLLHIGGDTTSVRLTSNQIKFNRSSLFSYIDQYGAGGIAFRTTESGSQYNRISIISNGNIGINEDAPSEKLQIDGDILLGGQANSSESNYAVKFEYNNHQFAKIVGDGRDSTGYGDIDFYTSTGSGVSNLTQRMTIRADGKVGIGSDTPVAHLDVANYQNVEVLRLRDRHYNKYLTIRGGGSPNRMVIDSYEGGGGGAAIDLASNGSTKLRISSVGELTSTAAQANVATFTSNQTASTIYVKDTDGDGIFISGSSAYGHRIYTNTTEDLLLGTNSDEKLRIDSNGNMGLGIGGAISDARFRIKGANNNTSAFNDGLMVTSNNETVYKKYSWMGIETKGGLSFHEKNSGSLVETMRITTGGNVGIGTDSIASGTRLHVFDGIVNVSSASTDTRIQFERKGTGRNSWIGIPEWNDDGLYIYGPTSNGNQKAALYEGGAWNLFTGGGDTAKFVITGAGNVGFNTNNPTNAFEAHALGNDANNFQQIAFERKTSANSKQAFGLVIRSNAQSSSGNEPTAYLRFDARASSLNGSHGGNAIIAFSPIGVTQGSYGKGNLDFYLRSGGTYTFLNDPGGAGEMQPKLRIAPDGNMALGTITPNSYSNQTTFTISGTNYGRLDVESGGVLRGSIWGTTSVLGVDASGGGVHFYAGSAYRGTVKSDGAINFSDTADNGVHSLSNNWHGNQEFVHRIAGGQRVLTSNGAGWRTSVDGADPILCLTSSADTGRDPERGQNYGLVLHTESQADNAYAPMIGFANRSNSGSYNTTFAAILAKKIGQATDANWSTGQLEFYTNKPSTLNNGYMTNIPDMSISQEGYVNQPRQPAFHANGQAASPHNSSGGQNMNLSEYMVDVITNIGSHYKSSGTDQGKFVAPIAGNYFFYGQALLRQVGNGIGSGELTFYKNGVNVASRALGYTYVTEAGGTNHANGIDHDSLKISCILTLAVGDKVHLQSLSTAAGVDWYWGSGLGNFGGYLIG